jgi:hypothetical protein
MIEVKTITPGPVRRANMGSAKTDPRADPVRLKKYNLLILFPALDTNTAMVKPLKRKGIERRM